MQAGTQSTLAKLPRIEPRGNETQAVIFLTQTELRDIVMTLPYVTKRDRVDLCDQWKHGEVQIRWWIPSEPFKMPKPEKKDLPYRIMLVMD